MVSRCEEEASERSRKHSARCRSVRFLVLFLGNLGAISARLPLSLSLSLYLLVHPPRPSRRELALGS